MSRYRHLKRWFKKYSRKYDRRNKKLSGKGNEYKKHFDLGWHIY